MEPVHIYIYIFLKGKGMISTKNSHLLDYSVSGLVSGNGGGEWYAIYSCPHAPLQHLLLKD